MSRAKAQGQDYASLMQGLGGTLHAHGREQPRMAVNGSERPQIVSQLRIDTEIQGRKELKAGLVD